MLIKIYLCYNSTGIKKNVCMLPGINKNMKNRKNLNSWNVGFYRVNLELFTQYKKKKQICEKSLTFLITFGHFNWIPNLLSCHQIHTYSMNTPRNVWLGKFLFRSE